MSVFVYIHEYEMTGQSFVLLANLPHDNNFLRHGNVSDRGGSVYTNGCVGHGISILIKGHLQKLLSGYFKNYVCPWTSIFHFQLPNNQVNNWCLQ